MKKFLIIYFSLISAGVFSFGQKDIVMPQAVKEKNIILLSLSVKNGYGIQKDGKHEIVIYELINGVPGKKPVRKITALKGTTAREDMLYYSQLHPVRIPIKNARASYLIKARFYYCSFSDKFCSLTKFEQNVP